MKTKVFGFTSKRPSWAMVFGGLMVLVGFIVPNPARAENLPASSADLATASLPVASIPVVLPQFLEIGGEQCDECFKMIDVLRDLRKKYAGIIDVISYDINLNHEIGPKNAVRLIPTQIILGRDGKEVFRHEGFWPLEQVEKELERLGLTSKKE